MPKRNPKCPTIKSLPKACSDELAAVEFMEKQRWSLGPYCPYCREMNVYKMMGRDGQRVKHYRWRCRDCNKQFSVRTGTVFEESRIPLMHWCFAFWRASTSKKGVSAMEIHRQTQVSYKSALFMLHRIRYAMTDGALPKLGPTSGTVEVDETFVGGRPRFRNVNRGRKVDFRTRKTPVVAAVERGGEVRASAIARISADNVGRHMIKHIRPTARIMTDEARIYDRIGRPFSSHERVNHSIYEYARGDVHTNTVEGFFSLLKRGLNGIYHHVSKKHLQNYVSEFQFRYNRRNVDDGERIQSAIQSAEGKRVKYNAHVGRKK